MARKAELLALSWRAITALFTYGWVRGGFQSLPKREGFRTLTFRSQRGNYHLTTKISNLRLRLLQLR